MSKISAIQEPIWLTQQLYPKSSLYNVGGYACIEGSLKETILIKSIKQILDNTDAITIGYYAFNETPLEKNKEFILYDITTLDFSADSNPIQSCLTWMQKDIKEAFNVNQNLLKVRILKASKDKYYWYVKVHHLVFDGYAMSLFFNTVSTRYSSRTNNKKQIDLALCKYSDFIENEATYKHSNEYELDKAFWIDKLKNIPEEKAFQSCLQSTNTETLSSKRKEIKISRELHKQIERFCKEHNCTVFHYFITILFILNKLYNNKDITIGIPVFNRSNSRHKNTLGTFVNVLPFGIACIEDISFIQLLQNTKDELKQCYRHQHFPLYDALKELDKKGNMYNISFSYQKNTYQSKLDNVNASIHYLHNSEQQDDLAFSLLEYSLSEDLTLAIDYKIAAFDEHVIDGLINHYHALIDNLYTIPEKNINDIDYLSEKEKQQLLVEFNDTASDYPKNKTIVDLFEAQVSKTSNNIAVVFEDKKLTYKELNEKSNQLANYLRTNYNIKPDDLIAIKLERSEWMIVAILGVLKSGGAYVPIDPEYPQERINYILADSKCKVVVDEEEVGKFKQEAKRYTKKNLKSINKSNDLAYVVYTSGSTGNPKGVMIEHKNLVNIGLSWIKEYKLNLYPVRLLQMASFSFDVFAGDVLRTFFSAGKMVICPSDIRVDPPSLYQLIKYHQITLFESTPSLVFPLMDYVYSNRLEIGNLKLLIIGSDICNAENFNNLQEWFGETIQIINSFGVTEATIDSSFYVADKSTNKEKNVPIGKPFQNTQICILGKNYELLPIGVFGEICIAGAGLARGYLNQPKLTAEKFVANPFKEGERIYKTGDLGRWLPDGNIEFIGRKDDQVKIRGYRIELGEIETALQKHQHIDAVVVIVKASKEGEKELVAYIVSKAALNTTNIRAYLSNTLPAYMLPNYFVQLEQLPLTPNGKIDRKKLPNPEGLDLASVVEYVAPRNEVEEKIVLIWQEILGKEKISIKDNFFELGGHSLKATSLASQIHKQFEVKLALKELFQKPILEEQAQLIQQAQKTIFNAIPIAAEQTSYSLSSAQRRLWILSQFEEGNIAYNMSGVYVFDGSLDKPALEQAFATLIKRHEILRTVFKENAQGDIRQFIQTAEEIRFTIAYQDLRREKKQAEKIRNLVKAEFIKPFNLSTDPLLRAGLLQTADDQCIFTYTMHHITSDGWSMGILIKELLLLYNAYIKGETNPLTPLRTQYKDYAAWQQDQLTSNQLQQHKTYWLKQFAGEIPVLELPADNLRPALKTYNGGAIHKIISSKLSKGLKALSQKQGGTLFMGLLATVNALLYRYTNQEDIIIGSPTAGREHVDLENQIGFYVNTLALRTQFNGADSYKELLEKVKQVTLEAYEHQIYPFDELVDELQLSRNMSRSALFDVMVVLENNEMHQIEGLHLGAVEVKEYGEIESPISKFDLIFNFAETEETLALSIEYNSDVYNKETIERLANHLQQLLEVIVKKPTIPINQLDYLSEAEKHQLLVQFNDTSVDHPQDKTIVDLFEEQAKKTPNNIAVVFEEKELTYKELNAKANQLANYLRTNYNIKPDDLIGIQFERSEWMIIAILGVLKSGGAYVPIDPEYPQERINYIIENSKCRVLIDEKEIERFKKKQHIYTTNNLISINKPSDLVYVIYTSGSTGKPKGVMIEHKSLNARICYLKHTYDLTIEDNLLFYRSYSFDGSIEEYLLPIMIGAKCCIAPIDFKQDIINNMIKLIERYKISKINMPPILLSDFVQVIDKYNLKKLSSLKHVVSGGDKLTQKMIIDYLSKSTAKLYNTYGPTENTIDSTNWNVEVNSIINIHVPIGKPIQNTQAYILDDNLQIAPIGVCGELYFGGAGLARGYLNQPELTAEKFVANPFKEGERIYKTGDLGRWLPDGNIEFIGRKDDQVKIRGYRIELGEIEAALQKHQNIEAAVVIAKANPQGEKELVAYIVSKEALNSTDIRTYLSSTLPAYMLPNYFVQLEKLPLTPNGKIDKKALPDSEGLGLSSGVEYVAPRNETEEKLVQIWQEILGKEKISIKDNFFELGGHSLKATRLASQTHKQFEVKIALKELFQKPMLEEQAQFIQQAQKTAFNTIPIAAEQTSYPLSSAQRRLWILSQFEEANIAYNMPGVYVFEGDLDKPALEQAFTTLIERHEILRTIFKEDAQGQVRQWIQTVANIGFKIMYKDVRKEKKQAEKIRKIVQAECIKPFNLATGPLLRANLYQIANDKWIFTYTMHHIISDGWSMNVLIKELLLFYNAQTKGESNVLSPLRIQYKDYASWQQEQLSGEQLQSHKTYWLEQFTGELPVLEMPTDKPRPAVKTYNGGAIHKTINAQLSKGLKALSQEQGATLFMGLLATVNTLLYRYTNQEDIIIGSPIAGREHADLEDQIGFYINTLALRTQFKGADSYKELLEKVKQLTLKAYEHQIYPFDELVDQLQLNRDMSRSALFDVMIVLQNNETHQAEGSHLGAIEVKEYSEVENQISKFDLVFNFVEVEEALQVSIEYNSDIYNKNSIEQLASHLEQLLTVIVEQPATSINQLDYLSDKERHQLLIEFNDTAVDYPKDKTIVDLFEEQAKKTPNNIAVVFEEKELTYQQLNEQSNQLANYLRTNYNIKPDDLIGIKLERSEWMIIAILGILKSGGAYVPIDLEYPKERINYMIKDSKCKLVIDEQELKNFTTEESEYATSNPTSINKPSNLAYVIYTSGSTGKPKGVMIEHQTIANTIQSQLMMFDLQEGEKGLQFASLSFDASVWEIFSIITSGGILYVIDEDKKKNPSLLEKYITENKIDFATLPPTYLQLLQIENIQTIKKLVTAGESAIIKDAVAFAQSGTYYNAYGPTESSICASIFRLDKGRKIETDIVPIGTPIPNTQIYIVDIYGNLLPLRAIGEIWIGGAGLARGYLSNRELTAEKFIPNPFKKGERMYKTGDLGRWLEDGNIEYIGRKDDQVKIRGYRIELGEIENALLKIPHIYSAIAITKTDINGNKLLVSYLTSQEELNISSIKSNLKQFLPDYMIPSHFIRLEEMPLTANGKIDRISLLNLQNQALISTVEYVAPSNEVQEKLVLIWEELLGIKKISIKANFFDLGGNSLSVTKLISLIHKEFDIKMSINDLFKNMILEEQAEIIQNLNLMEVVDFEEDKNNKNEKFSI